MVTKQLLKGLSEDADLRRADSLAREIFSDVANKWALLIIEALGERTLRFSELREDLLGPAVGEPGPAGLRAHVERRRPGRGLATGEEQRTAGAAGDQA